MSDKKKDSWNRADFGTFKVFFGLDGSCSHEEWLHAIEVMENAPATAADLAAVRAERDALKADRDAWRVEAGIHKQSAFELAKERDALRTSLEAVIDWHDESLTDGVAREYAIRKARAALAAK